MAGLARRDLPDPAPRRRLRCFIELDRGRPVRSWHEKIMAYRAYVGSAELRERYVADNFILLVATTTASC
jgi:hypothetical protein